MQFRVDRRNGIAVYQQIVQQTKQALQLGQLMPGDRLPTAEEVADTCEINPNTVLKAYRVLAREELVETRRALGTVIRQSPSRVGAAECSALREELAAWMERAHTAGLDREHVAALVMAEVETRYDNAPGSPR